MTLGTLISRIVGIYLFVSGLRMAGGAITGGGVITPAAWPAFVLPILFMIAGALLFARPIRSFDVTLPSGEVDLKRLELTAFRIVGLLVVFVASIPFLFGSLSGLLQAILNPELYRIPWMEQARGSRVGSLVGWGGSVVLGVIQLLLGMWLLLHPEDLISRIERWRAKRQLGYFEEDLSETSSKGEEN